MPGGKSANPRRSLFIALAIVLTSPVSAAEVVWPKNSASDLSIFATLQRFQSYADHCSDKVPQLKPKFEILMENLNNHIQGISRVLLASDVFKGMKEKPVPAEIVHALEDNVDDAKHNFERLDAASICPKTLQSLGEKNDESLKSDLTEMLAAVQNMIRMREKQDARQASPNP